jgi:hypothetical protein
MSILHYEIPKIFFIYANRLSDGAFCVLLKFYKYYLENDSTIEITLTFENFQKQFLSNLSLKDENIVWTELTFQELLVRYYKEDVYELNVTKILNENRIFLKSEIQTKRRRFRIKVLDRPQVSLKEKRPEISDHVEKFASKYENDLKKKIIRTFELIIENSLKRGFKIKVNEILNIISIFANENEQDIDYVCSIYSNASDSKKAHPSYIRAIFRNIKDKKKRNELSTESLKRYKEKQDESDKQFGIEIATGIVLKENNTSYLSYLKLKDYDGLRTLYKIGQNILIAEQRQFELYTKYDWLE